MTNMLDLFRTSFVIATVHFFTSALCQQDCLLVPLDQDPIVEVLVDNVPCPLVSSSLVYAEHITPNTVMVNASTSTLDLANGPYRVTVYGLSFEGLTATQLYLKFTARSSCYLLTGLEPFTDYIIQFSLDPKGGQHLPFCTIICSYKEGTQRLSSDKENQTSISQKTCDVDSSPSTTSYILPHSTVLSQDKLTGMTLPASGHDTQPTVPLVGSAVQPTPLALTAIITIIVTTLGAIIIIFITAVIITALCFYWKRKRLQQRRELKSVTSPPVSTPQPTPYSTTTATYTKSDEYEYVSTKAAYDDDYEEMDIGPLAVESYATLSKETMTLESQYTAISNHSQGQEHYMPLSKHTLTEQQYYTSLTSMNTNNTT